MNQKYEITDIQHPEFPELRRIRALVNIPGALVEKGDLGGWVENPRNLDQNGNCWVADNAIVRDNAGVIEDAQVEDGAIVSGRAVVCNSAKVRVKAQVFDDALIRDKAIVAGESQVYDEATVKGDACIVGFSKVYGDARVGGDAKVLGYAKIYGAALVGGNARITNYSEVCDNAMVVGRTLLGGSSFVGGSITLDYNLSIYGNSCITSSRDILVVGPIGSEDGTLVITRLKDNEGFLCTRGCFSGTVEEFRNAVEARHGNNEHAIQYNAILEYAKVHFGMKEQNDQ